ncbi:MAG: type II toxin-antitoxin system RelE/ParE family toxin [Olsenella sp.]|jgi:plasmid stabilization system protein ParE|nr:type II toxin-antitoxin system RelE/ParE family toxin [Olsenella sp.]
MGYRVIVSDPANKDLEAAISYAATTLQAPSAASSLLDTFEEKLVLLADNPRLFGVDMLLSEAVHKQVRRCAVKRYGIYCTIDESDMVVTNVAFAHGLRDIPKLMNDR